MQGNHRGRMGQAQNHTSIPQRTSLWTPRYQPNKGLSSQVLLVAATKQGHPRIRQRMRSMPTKQSKHASSESTLIPHNPDNWSAPLSNHYNGLYCKTTRIGRIRFHSYDYRPRLHQDANRDTLQRNYHSGRSSRAIPATDLSPIWTTLEDNQRPRP